MAGGGVIPAAGLDFVVRLLGLDQHFTKRAVPGSVGGRVSNVVLATQFLRNLVKSLPQFLDLVSNFDDSAARLLGQLLHIGNAGVATETIRKSAIRDEQNVADGVSLLRSFDGIFDLEPTALIFSVGKQDHRLPANFVAEFIVRCEIDRVIKCSAAWAS